MQNQLVEKKYTGLSVLMEGKLVQIAGAMLLGLTLVYGLGFLNVDAVHNAAHDTRHSQGFPCH